MTKHTNILRLITGAALLALAMNVCGQITAFMTSDARFNYIGGTASHQVVDSIVGIGIFPDGEKTVVTRQTKTRNKMGFLTEETSWIIGPDSNMIPSIKKSIRVDKAGRPVESVFYNWDDDVEYFFDEMKYEYKYYDNDACVIKRYYQDEDDRWILSDSIRLLTTYNSNMDPAEINTETWRNGAWTPSQKEIYTYDSKNRITGIDYYGWDNRSWNINTRKTMTYNNEETHNAVLKEMYWNGQMWKDMSHSVGRTQLLGMEKTIYTSILTKVLTKEDEEKPKNKQGFYINAGNEKAYIYIYDSKGKLLNKEKVTNTKFINLGKYGTGTYTIKINQRDRSVSRKIKIN
ncbi:MAG: T9SS type A sorting domain-containing protein [Paludibacteraceae bacterium]|nr:T9SS type A sorting domain-containing protein [Paludibacteraceae bacterium]